MVKYMCSKSAVLGVALAFGTGAALAQAGAGGQGGGAQGTMNSAGSAANQGARGTMNSMNSMAGMNGSGASMQDKMFLKNATQGSNFEIKTAQLALQKSQSQDVKQFAQKMIDDHTKLNDDMKPVAQEANVTPPTGLSKKDQAIYAKLEGMSGDAFDKAYIQDMVKDHQADLKQFKQEASSGQLQSEKTAAGQGAQVVDGHLQMAQQLAQAHNVSTGGSNSGQ